MSKSIKSKKSWTVYLEDAKAIRKAGKVHTGFGKDENEAIEYVCNQLKSYGINVSKKDLIVH